MKVINLSADSQIYTANVYLVTGTWNALGDINTLVDVGRDPLIIDKILNAHTGVGKTRIEQVVLTHSHYDHASLLPKIKEMFNPKVYAYSSALEGVDHLLCGGEELKIGDQLFEVIYTPGHSHDSLCFYCESERVLFAGDTPIVNLCGDSTYEESFLHSIETIARKKIETIYFGHGNALQRDCQKALQNTLKTLQCILNKHS